jgi:hypothetical protein
MKLADKVAYLLAAEPLMDVVLASASAVAMSIKELPVTRREHARLTAHELIDDMLEEWATET